jgi:hypothetical protein
MAEFAIAAGEAALQVAIAYGVNYLAQSLSPNRRISATGLESLSVQISSYGKNLPYVAGNLRLAGNIIWAKDLKEVTTYQEQGGGKGGMGGGASVENKRYYATLAIAICVGEILAINRVWADSKQLTVTDLSVAAGKYEIYTGSETQTASPIIEGYEGMGNVPAYRGVSYVVIEDFPLENFGNRIPNFTFEVQRPIRGDISLEEKIKAITLIPGSGEYVYSRVKTEKIEYVSNDTGISFKNGPNIPLNTHTHEQKPNVEVAIEQMEKALPNLEYVSVIVNWFATSKYPNRLEIVPKVEYNINDFSGTPQLEGAYAAPEDWLVNGIVRDSAMRILKDSAGNLNYGGTPTDKSILEICKYLHSKGYKVTLYPMIQIDTLTEIDDTEDNKPWRGRITPTSISEVTRFFSGDGGYNDFILHYANLNISGEYLKDYLEAIIIGSELVGLTTYSNATGSYPAVTALKSLASSVKSAVGSVKVTYAADWSEYHSVNGWFHLDPLWSDSNIDFVSIDAYFPLTPDLSQNDITQAKIKEYWQKGEGWDYYWNNDRTIQNNFSGFKYAWKNFEYWWKNTHVNPNSVTTAWTAKMKPIWFTEIGFPSVDGCANQPNVFYDPKSIESYFPRASEGHIDYEAQREALEASLDFLSELNAEAGNNNLVPIAHVWTWDARPYPYWPELMSIWADGILYPYGHWIQGKVGVAKLDVVVEDLLNLTGLSSDYIFDLSNGFKAINQKNYPDDATVIRKWQIDNQDISVPSATNYLLYSNDLDNAAWTASPSKITSGTIKSIDGSESIPLREIKNVYYLQNKSGLVAGNYTLSFEIYADFTGKISTRLPDGASNTGTPNNVQIDVSPQWKRHYLSGSITTGQQIRIIFDGRDSAVTPDIPNGGKIAIRNLQLETGTVPTPYISTTTATVTRTIGIAKDYMIYQLGSDLNKNLSYLELVTRDNAVNKNRIVTNQYAPNDYDLTALKNNIVEGFVIKDETSVRAALDSLKTAYHFTLIEVNGQIKAVKYGNDNIATIVIDETIANDNDARNIPFEITRQDNTTLPYKMQVTGLSRSRDYNNAAQISVRQSAVSKQFNSIELPLVLSDSKMKQLADTSLYRLWAERDVYKFSLPPKYGFLSPSDIIIFDDKRLRILSVSQSQHLATEINAVSDDASIFNLALIPSSGSDTLKVVNPLSDTNIFFLDLPSLPSDKANDTNIRYAINGQSKGWNGTVLYESIDDDNFTRIQSTTSQATIGKVLNAIPIGTIYGFDVHSEILVALETGELQSVTEKAILNGANSALIGNEIIQFQDAELIGNNYYRLTNLLRGRLGTEYLTNTHAVGDVFILLDEALIKQERPFETLGIERFYKAVTFRQNIADIDALSHIYHGNSLKCYSPVHIKGERNTINDLNISWIRRARVGGDWKNNTDIPLIEEFEKYEIEILNGSSVMRTITTTSPTYLYTSGLQITDFGIFQSSVSVRIYQIGLTGRGIAGIATL